MYKLVHKKSNVFDILLCIIFWYFYTQNLLKILIKNICIKQQYLCVFNIYNIYNIHI